MTFTIHVMKEKSTDPYFKVNVSIRDDAFSISNAQVEVLRLPPRVTIQYPDEMKDILPQIDQKKLELEILNKVVEHIMLTTDKAEINMAAFFGRKI